MRIFRSFHLILLVYIIAAIVYWWISLQKLNGRIYDLQVISLQSQIDSASDPGYYDQQMEAYRHKLALRTTQYVGEGGTFLVVILIGAVVVYSSLNRRISLSRQQNNFMLSVTHELKSPIAGIKLNLQTMAKHQLTEEQKTQLVARCVKEADRLNDLCNNMLFASQIEGRQYKAARELLDLSQLVEDSVEDYALRYPRRIEEDIESGVKTSGDRVMLQMAVNNLLENAVKYTPGDKHICVKLFTNQKNIIIQVIDQGVGIPDEEKKNIFDKFYRVGNEESRKSRGTGLGLYLTNKIVLQHKGRIIVKDNTPSGSIFEICLPLS
jgi:signal transduction histidine kinase